MQSARHSSATVAGRRTASCIKLPSSPRPRAKGQEPGDHRRRRADPDRRGARNRPDGRCGSAPAPMRQAGRPAPSPRLSRGRPCRRSPGVGGRVRHCAFRANRNPTMCSRCATFRASFPTPGRPILHPCCHGSIRVPRTSRKRASQAGCAGQAGAVTKLPSTCASSTAISI